MRQRAPSSLIPERQTALKTQIPSQKTTLHSLLFAAISEVQPFLQITCACSAPKYRPWANSPKKIRSALWVNPTVIPSVCLGETAHRYDEKALADSLTGRNGLKNGFLDLGIFFFFFFPTERHKPPRSLLPVWRTIQTDRLQYRTGFRAERSPNAGYSLTLGSLGPLSSQLPSRMFGTLANGKKDSRQLARAGGVSQTRSLLRFAAGSRMLETLRAPLAVPVS